MNTEAFRLANDAEKSKAQPLVELKALGSEDATLQEQDNPSKNGQRFKEQALETSQTHLQEFFQHSSIVFYSCSPQKRYALTFISQNVAALLGYSANDCICQKRSWLDLIHPDDRAKVLENFRTLKRSELPTLEYRCQHQNGTYRWVRDALHFSEKHEELLGSLIDITDRKTAEIALEASEAKFRQLAEDANDIVYSFSKDGRFTYLSPKFTELFGYSTEEFIGRTSEALTYQEDLETVAAFDHKVLETGEKQSGLEVRVVCKDGSICWITCNSSPIFDADDNVVGFHGVARDITHRKQAEQLKNELISLVSHEIRTPLTSIYGALKILMSKKATIDSQRAKRYLELAATNADWLIRLVNDILDLERLESGVGCFEKKTWNITELIAQALETSQIMALQAGVVLSLNIEPFWLEVNGEGIVQVLTNLLSNAVKFSPKGSTVCLSASQAIHPSPYCLIAIKDEGCGIPENKLDSIFERFHQVDVADSRRRGGTGLGLAICRNIIQQHGGKIWVKSKLNQGSCFYVMLPLAQTSDLEAIQSLD